MEPNQTSRVAHVYVCVGVYVYVCVLYIYTHTYMHTVYCSYSGTAFEFHKKLLSEIKKIFKKVY